MGPTALQTAVRPRRRPWLPAAPASRSPQTAAAARRAPPLAGSAAKVWSRPNGCGSSPRTSRRARPEDGRDDRVEGGASEQDVLRARQPRSSQLRVVPHAAQVPPQQRREHPWEVRRLEARPRFVEEPTPLLLVADAAHRGVEGDLPEERPAEPRREPRSCATFPALEVLFIDPPLLAFACLAFASPQASVLQAG